jgi:hypothetical protein
MPSTPPDTGQPAGEARTGREDRGQRGSKWWTLVLDRPPGQPRPVQATAQQQRTKRPGLAAFPAGKCSKPADTRYQVPDADSDRARLPGTGPASEDVPAKNHQRADLPALVTAL